LLNDSIYIFYINISLKEFEKYLKARVLNYAMLFLRKKTMTNLTNLNKIISIRYLQSVII